MWYVDLPHAAEREGDFRRGCLGTLLRRDSRRLLAERGRSERDWKTAGSRHRHASGVVANSRENLWQKVGSR